VADFIQNNPLFAVEVIGGYFLVRTLGLWSNEFY